jgi:hypothetical protein|tara:strand:- start:6016 stop:6177 length:162 start_codon:yes stop_codon:yes gene_type:complete
MEEYKIINRGRKGNDYYVISVHYSHIDAVNSFDQLRGMNSNLNLILKKTKGDK